VCIGGLAVICRLQRAHRATGDVDTVTDRADALAMVAEIDGAEMSGNDIIIEGVPVQVIDTADLPDHVADIEPVLARLFVVSHRYAFTTATAVGVVAGSVNVQLRVATPAALIATKAGALAERRDQRKRASDTTDLIGLLDRHGADAAVELRSAAHDLGMLVAGTLEQVLVSDAGRRARDIRAFGEPEWAMEPADIALVGSAFCARLRG
jgi:hypothetical protein